MRRMHESLASVVVLSLLIAVGIASRRVITTQASLRTTAMPEKVREPRGEPGQQQLKADLSNSAFAADLATMRTYQKVLVRELERTSRALTGRPKDVTLLKRRELLQSLLANHGGTGVNDRLDVIERSLRIAESRVVSTPDDEAMLHRTIADLRSSVASWKTGSFANAGRYLGLQWVDGRGLVTSTPYIWGRYGWKVDPALTAATSARSGQADGALRPGELCAEVER